MYAHGMGLACNAVCLAYAAGEGQVSIDVVYTTFDTDEGKLRYAHAHVRSHARTHTRTCTHAGRHLC